MTKKFLIITILSFITFVMSAPQITTSGIWAAIVTLISLGVMFMSLNSYIKS